MARIFGPKKKKKKSSENKEKWEKFYQGGA
jgi:hypothetical protein